MKKRELKEQIDRLEKRIAELEEQQRAPNWVIPYVPPASVYPDWYVPPAMPHHWYPDWTWYPTITCTTNAVEGGVW